MLPRGSGRPSAPSLSVWSTAWWCMAGTTARSCWLSELSSTASRSSTFWLVRILSRSWSTPSSTLDPEKTPPELDVPELSGDRLLMCLHWEESTRFVINMIYIDTRLMSYILGYLAVVHRSSWGCLQKHQDHRWVLGWWADQRCQGF